MSAESLAGLVVAEPPPAGAPLLDAVRAFLRRFIAFPSEHALTAVTLWIAHTHLIDAWENTPRLALLSPEPGSGKTRVLEVVELLAPAPMHVLNASPAAIFRTIQANRPTLLLDEVDTVFTRRGKDDEHADLRGLLNSGYRAGASIPRCVGPRHDVEHFPTFCAVALAGLGDLPDTLMTRSVVIRMQRRAPGETVEPFRRRLHRAAGEALRDQLAAWASAITQDVREVYPELPEGITDRPADVWEPLVAVADAAGSDWPKAGREACTELVMAAQSTDSGSLGIRLLADLKVLFGTARQLPTAEVLSKLCEMPEAPWSSLYGEPIDARGLASRLKQYGVSSAKVRLPGRPGVVQGYRAADLYDAWQRYVPPAPAKAEHPEHTEHPSSDGASDVPDASDVPEHPVGGVLDVPEHESRPEQDSPPLSWGVPAVPAVPEHRGEEPAHKLNGFTLPPGMAPAVGPVRIAPDDDPGPANTQRDDSEGVLSAADRDPAMWNLLPESMRSAS